MDAFEGHPDVYERDVIEVELSPTSNASVSTSAAMSSCSGGDDAFCGAVGNVSGPKEATSGRLNMHATKNSNHSSGEPTKTGATPSDVDVIGCGQDDTLQDQQQQQMMTTRTTTCTCFVYFFKRFVPELVELESYGTYDAISIPGKPYQPE